MDNEPVAHCQQRTGGSPEGRRRCWHVYLVVRARFPFIPPAQVDREFKKLDHYTKRMIKSWIIKNLQGCEDPRLHGKALTGDKKGLWRYRIGDYRLICSIQDDKLIILALSVGHRREIYS